MFQTVQLAIADPVYAAALREALTRSGPWQVVSAQQPDPRHQGVLIIDEDALDRIPLPLPNPERVVLITEKDPHHLSRAWDAGVVSVVSRNDPTNTVLLAIMAAALRVHKAQAATVMGGISPNAAANTPEAPGKKRL
ncbi:MAG: DNA-binding response regulator [Planctomycetaceae bacterium]|nr:MAG: DNA-binding response regulator [Planctomycetaceae bacterium]